MGRNGQLSVMDNIQKFLKEKKEVLSKDIVAATGHSGGAVHIALGDLLINGIIERRQLSRDEIKNYKTGALPYVYSSIRKAIKNDSQKS
jgi:predicted transcriptional regulator